MVHCGGGIDFGGNVMRWLELTTGEIWLVCVRWGLHSMVGLMS